MRPSPERPYNEPQDAGDQPCDHCGFWFCRCDLLSSTLDDDEDVCENCGGALGPDDFDVCEDCDDL